GTITATRTAMIATTAMISTKVNAARWPALTLTLSPGDTAIDLRSADFSPPRSGPAKTAASGLKSALLSCRKSLNSMAVPPGEREQHSSVFSFFVSVGQAPRSGESLSGNLSTDARSLLPLLGEREGVRADEHATANTD